MTDLQHTIDRYFDWFNATDDATRRAAVVAAWGEDARYVDPLFDARGHGGLAELAAQVQARFPGHRFRRTSDIDAHHGLARWQWDMVGPDGGPPVATGVDFGVLAEDGRLREVVGFFESVNVPA